MKRNPHPALAKVEDPEDGDIILMSQAFQSLTFDQRHFLLNYGYHRDWKKAQVTATVSSEWLLKQEQDPKFVEVVNRILDYPEVVATMRAKDAAPEAMEKMVGLMQQGENKDAQYKASKFILGAVGITEGDAVQVNTQFNVSIQMWPREGQIIDQPTRD